MSIGIGVSNPKATGSNVSSLASDAINTQATGSTFVVGVISGAGVTIGAPTDNKGNNGNYVQIQSTVTDGSNFKIALFYCENGAGGTGHVFTANVTGGVATLAIFVVEITGGLTSGIKDKDVAGLNDVHSDATPFVSNTTATTAQNKELALAFIGTRSNSGTETLTWGNGFAKVIELNNASMATGGIGVKTLTSQGAVQSSVTSANAGTTAAISFVATFKDTDTGSSGGLLARFSKGPMAGGMQDLNGNLR